MAGRSRCVVETAAVYFLSGHPPHHACLKRKTFWVGGAFLVTFEAATQDPLAGCSTGAIANIGDRGSSYVATLPSTRRMDMKRDLEGVDRWRGQPSNRAWCQPRQRSTRVAPPRFLDDKRTPRCIIACCPATEREREKETERGEERETWLHPRAAVVGCAARIVCFEGPSERDQIACGRPLILTGARRNPAAFGTNQSD